MKMLLDMLIRSEQIDIGLLILDARARVRVANPKFRRWYGFKEGDELSEKTVLGQTLRQAIRERRVVSEAVIRDEWNGNLVTVMLFAYPCEDNKQSDWAVFAADASSSRRHIRQRMLTEKVETIGQMASGTANAVLNPLAVIKGSMQMIEKHLDDFFVDEGLVGSSLHSRIRTFFRLIDDQIQRINDIIQQFLLLGKPFAMELTPLAIVDFLQHLQQRVMKKALDKQIRQKTQIELARILEQVGVTCVMVTHDQEEAMTMADRLAVMTDGQIVQYGTPREVYDFPVSRFVAGFIGSANLFTGTIVVDEPDHIAIECDELPRPLFVSHGVSEPLGMEVHVSIRPERVVVSRTQPQGEYNWARGVVSHMAWLGSHALYHIRLDSGKVVEASVPSLTLAQSDAPGLDDEVFVGWDPDSAKVLAS